MKLNKSIGSKSSSTIRVKVNEIKNGILECTHVVSNIKIKAFYKEEMDIEVGQIVMVEYTSNNKKAGYVVTDDLADNIEAKVLEAQHILANGVLYTSLIIENTENKQRMHSLIPSYNSLFSKTNIIISGDVVNIKVNNGEIFNIKQKETQ